MTISAPLQPSMHRRQILTEEELAKGEDVEQEEKTFPDIPLDIARLVFEKAMEDSPIPVHLALVSRQVQQWYVLTIPNCLPPHSSGYIT